MKKLKIKKSPGQKPKLPTGEYGFVIGNGTSRQDLDVKVLKDYGLVFACNWFFRQEFAPHVLIASDEPISRSIQKDTYPKRNWFYTWYPKPGSGSKKSPTPEKLSAGSMAAFIAAHTYECRKVFFVGIDFFGKGSPADINDPDNNGVLNNLYEGMKHYAKEAPKGAVNGAPTFRNWQRRFQWVIQEFEKQGIEFWHVNPFEGKTPPRIRGLLNYHTCTYENLVDHLENDVELVDTLERTFEDVKHSYESNPDNYRASIERQVCGQNNVLFPDPLPMREVYKIRAEVFKIQRENPGAMIQAEINGMKVSIPGLGDLDENGQPMLPMNTDLRGAPRPTQGMVPPPPPPMPKVPGGVTDVASMFGDLPPPPPPPGSKK